MNNLPLAYGPVPGPPVNPSLEEPAMTTAETDIEKIVDDFQGTIERLSELHAEIRSLVTIQSHLLAQIDMYRVVRESQP